MIEKIKNIVKENYDKLVEIRRHIHSHPEIGGQEYNTQKLIIDTLENLGCYKIQKSFNTGVVALIEGKKSKSEKCIGLRADIDALGIYDLKDVEYKSQNEGVCHACGHDVHTTVLLGVAISLAKLQNEFSGYVKLFFQPAEENIGGAEPMIKEGHMENPHVDVMLGLHVSEAYDAGMFRFCYNTMQASCNDLKIVIKGYSSHAAHPENGVDSILIASQIINNLQSIVSRNVAATDSVALSFGKINGGTINNALAESVTIEGTLRTLNFNTRDIAIRNIQRMCDNIAKAYGGSAEVTVYSGYPPLINNEEMVDFVKNNAIELVGKQNVIINNIPSLGVEDFAYFAKEVPSCFYNLGCKNESKGIIYPGHNNKFDVDEESIYYGVLLQVYSVITWLNK